ncbi:MAG TPA: tripartite tricarboxylate transporter TctB family protein [Usitatibacter sp.]|nr:tripartite tricarboxylate transporter TctB family protein [Usitatibacter sp.]
MKLRFKPMLPYLALLAGAGFLYHDTTRFAALGRPGQLGPDFWPRAVLVLLMLVCAFEMVRLALASEAAPQAQPKAPAAHEEEDGPRYPLLLASGIGITILYVPGMQVLGFFIATALYLAGFMLVGRYRRAGVIAASSLIGSLAFVFVFMKVVYVSLPLGVGPFQTVSTWLMAMLGIH